MNRWVKKPRPQPMPTKAVIKLTVPFDTACRKGNLAKVRSLIEEGADPVHGHPSFSPPLITAAFGPNPAVVTLLLERGAPLEAYGAGALAAAAGRDDEGGEAVFVLLLSKGALAQRSGPWSRGHAPGLTVE
jgi:ankyrin repeat protein